MAKDLDLRGPRGLAPYGAKSATPTQPITISPVTALFLRTVWGTERLTRLVDSQTNLLESLQRFTNAHLRLDSIEKIVEQELQVEEHGRKLTYKNLSYEIAQVDMKTELLDSERALLIQERLTEMARLKADARQHDQQGVSVPKKEEPARQETGDPIFDKSKKRMWRDLEIRKELAKMEREVDEAVAQGIFKPDEAGGIKSDMEQIIRAGLRSTRD